MTDDRRHGDARDHRQIRRAELAGALDEVHDPIARRDFVKLLGAALGLAGLGGCTRAPSEEIVPYVVQPPEVKPGRASHYASALTLDGYATGVLVESHEGRPTKVEGNPDHPASLGATGVYEQAAVLSLYDPSRARATKRRGTVTSWADVASALASGAYAGRRGRGLHVLLEPTSSPTMADLLADLRARWPEATVHFYAPASPTAAWDGARLAFGRVLEPRLDLTRADVIVALDADFLSSGPANLRLARQFADRRRLVYATDSMNRLYAVEALLSVTGTAADHRLRLPASEVSAFAAALLHAVRGAELPGGGVPEALRAPMANHVRFVDAVARDLLAHRRRSVVIAGPGQPALVHAMAHAINAALGNLGSTVALAPSPILEAGERSHDLGALAAALEAGEVDTLAVLGTNVAYTAPADRRLALDRARQSVYLGIYEDETARSCTFSVAEAHALESWGDARAFDGTVSIVQPLIEPLFGGRTALDVVAVLAGAPPSRTSYDQVRARAASASPGPSQADDAWRRALTRGLTDDPPLAPVDVPFAWRSIAGALARAGAEVPGASAGASAGARDLELVFPLDARVHDGRFTNNAWLLELPEPVTKLTWMNAATLGPDTAARLGVKTGDEIELTHEGRTVRAPALIAPGQAESTVGLALGWGREGSEELARGLGASAYALRTSRAPHFARGVTVHRTARRHDLPITQRHRGLEHRDEQILQHVTLEEHRRRAASPPAGTSAPRTTKRPLALYDVRPRSTEHQWAMVVDLSACTGCSACVVACQAENNVPTVGRDGVLRGREMHWLRIDSYLTGDPHNPEVLRQPMLCQHCEKAPCEYVCPVNATVHSSDGLNEMVYNRCVGTRFCSNNCPYKVRRFNWFDYHRAETGTEQLVHNPDVTVRERGVMEKCTFCVQRIREHELRRRTGRAGPTDRAAKAPLQTACQQACPTRAIVFGDQLDATSAVARLARSDRAYAALDELGTVPRVRYLRKVRNANPELA
jgi:molybdopterin-containing oxidoreductase family iron-sulfur binding subunit